MIQITWACIAAVLIAGCSCALLYYLWFVPKIEFHKSTIREYQAEIKSMDSNLASLKRWKNENEYNAKVGREFRNYVWNCRPYTFELKIDKYFIYIIAHYEKWHELLVKRFDNKPTNLRAAKELLSLLKLHEEENK
jgi:hypothetical protein